jgi:fructokinase
MARLEESIMRAGEDARVYGGVEAGGTKFVCVIGTGSGGIVNSRQIQSGMPAETLAAVVAFFSAAIEAGTPLAAIGIGSVGPVELRSEHPHYGWITTTPKLRWANTDLVGPVAAAFGLPVGFDTDVTAAALGEFCWGAAKDLRSFVYPLWGRASAAQQWQTVA